MDGHIEEVSFLGASVRRSTNDLRAAVRATTHEGRGAQFAVYMSAAIDAVDARVDELLATATSSSDSTDIAAISNQIRLVRQYVRALHRWTTWLGDKRAPSLGLGLVYFFEETADVLLQSSADLVMRDQADYNYTVVGLDRPFGKLLSSLGATLPPGPPPILIGYPTLERDRVLLHPIFVHELGHEAVMRESLLDRTLGAHPDVPALEAQFKETVRLIRLEHVARGESVTDLEVEIDPPQSHEQLA